MLKLTSINKNVNLGIAARANDSFCVVPRGIPEGFEDEVKEVLGVEVVRTNLYGTSIIGAFLVMNNKGGVVSDIVYGSEVAELREAGLKIEVVKDRFNALGNLVLAGDRGAIAYSGLRKKSIEKIEKALDCPMETIDALGNYRTVGSIGISTSKGALFHPNVHDRDLEFIEKVLKVNVDIGTVNMGVGFVRTGMVANKNGALIGENTTGPEILRVEEALGYI